MKKNSNNIANIFYNISAILIIIAIFSLFSWGGLKMNYPISYLENTTINLDRASLFEYTIRTITRMLIATFLALVFAIIYGTIAAKNKRAERILIPILDVLQSAPILGYISFALLGFMSIFPNSGIGPEMAAIFAIFTSQAWNMTFSIYQSIRNVPRDFHEVAAILKLSAWQKFWRLEMPFATPSLIWNMMISVSGGWFFVVACEAITVGNQQFLLPGVGSYIAVAISQENIEAILNAIMVMALVILIYDRMFFRPLVVWSEKFRHEITSYQYHGNSLILKIFQRSVVIKTILKPLSYLGSILLRINFSLLVRNKLSGIVLGRDSQKSYIDILWPSLIITAIMTAILIIYSSLHQQITISEIIHVALLGIYTGFKVIILVMIASIIWVPIGIYIGLRPRLTEFMQPIVQFCAAFPANLLFPIVVILISSYGLNPNIWLGFLMILGAQWYILFNVIAGASMFSPDLRDVVKNYKLKGFTWWKKIIIPAIIPYFLTGALAAAGGAWNASIVAEIVNWGGTELRAEGIGSYIVLMMRSGDYYHITLGIIIMCLLVILMNIFFWHPIYRISLKKFPMT